MIGKQNISLDFKYTSDLKVSFYIFKLEKLLYNTVLIKMPYYFRIILNSFTTDYSQNYTGIIDACLVLIE